MIPKPNQNSPKLKKQYGSISEQRSKLLKHASEQIKCHQGQKSNSGGVGWGLVPGAARELTRGHPSLPSGTGLCVLVARSCLTLRDPMDCSPPGSTVHGILQARTLEWAATASSRGLPDPGLNTALLHCGQILHCWTTGKLSGTGKAEHYHQMLEKPAWVQAIKKDFLAKL